MRRNTYQQGSLRLRHRVRGPGLWEFRYRFTDVDGKRRIRSVFLGTTVQYPTKSHLGAKIQGLVLSINRGGPIREVVTMDSVISRFIADGRLEEIHRRIKPIHGALHYSTAHAYLAALRTHIRPKWGSLPLTSIRPAAVQEWLDGIPLAPKSKANIRGLLHQLFEKALLWEYIDLQRNPIDLVKIKGVSKRQKQPTILTAEQFHAIVERLPRLPQTVVIVAQCTGLRISEILALQWNDIDKERMTLQVTRAVVNGRVDDVKTEYSKDLLPLDPSLARALDEWRAYSPPSPEGWVFANRYTRKPYSATYIRDHFLTKVGVELGIRLGWHTFRHTYRSWLDATGAPIGVQQKLMRHAQVATTMNVYGNALMHSKRDANSKIVAMVLDGKQNS